MGAGNGRWLEVRTWMGPAVPVLEPASPGRDLSFPLAAFLNVDTQDTSNPDDPDRAPRGGS